MLAAGLPVIRMHGAQPALVQQLLDRQPGELRAEAVDVVQRGVWPSRPYHAGRAIQRETKPLFALAQRPLGTGASRPLDQQGGDGRGLDRDDDQKGADDVRHRWSWPLLAGGTGTPLEAINTTLRRNKRAVMS